MKLLRLLSLVFILTNTSLAEVKKLSDESIETINNIDYFDKAFQLKSPKTIKSRFFDDDYNSYEYVNERFVEVREGTPVLDIKNNIIFKYPQYAVLKVRKNEDYKKYVAIVDNNNKPKYLIESQNVKDITTELDIRHKPARFRVYEKDKTRIVNKKYFVSVSGKVQYENTNPEYLDQIVGDRVETSLPWRLRMDVFAKTKFPIELGLTSSFHFSTYETETDATGETRSIAVGPVLKLRIAKSENHYFKLYTLAEKSIFHTVYYNNENFAKLSSNLFEFGIQFEPQKSEGVIFGFALFREWFSVESPFLLNFLKDNNNHSGISFSFGYQMGFLK